MESDRSLSRLLNQLSLCAGRIDAGIHTILLAFPGKIKERLSSEKSTFLSFQVSLIELCGKPENLRQNSLPFLHPFFSATATAHIYNSFRLFEEKGQLRVIKWADEFPARIKTSRVETGTAFSLSLSSKLTVSLFLSLL